MNILLLFFAMLLISTMSYNFSRYHFLSPAFLSSLSFAIIAFEYYIFLDYIGRDISLKLFLLVTLSILSIAFGEFIANKLVIVHNNREIINRNMCEYALTKEIVVPKKITILLSLIIFITAFARIFKLLGFSGIHKLSLAIVAIRSDFARGMYSYGIVLSALYYVALFVAYIYAFLFVFQLKIHKKFQASLLIPIVGYCICAISTTARTEYIKLACVFLTAYFILNLMKKNENISLIKIGIFSIVFICFFFWYGYAIRGVVFSGRDSIVDGIIGYSCASLYGLDNLLNNPWDSNRMFGEYTLKNIYSIMGNKVSSDYQPTFFMLHGKSNIYTFLDFPFQDYGMIGTILSRFILAFIATKIQNSLMRTSFHTQKYYFLFIAVCHNVYIFLMASIGDKAYLFYLNPKLLIELLGGGMLAFMIGLKFLIVGEDSAVSIKSRIRIKKNEYHK